MYFVFNYAYKKGLIGYSYYRLSLDLLAKYGFAQKQLKYKPFEIIEIMKEIYMNPVTRKKIMNITISHIDYALRNFAVANTKQKIQKPKAYFKQCLLSALEQTELSKQLDTDTIYEMGDY